MFGTRLKTARLKHGLSQADLAQQIDAPPQQVQRWEKSSTAPTGETLKTLAKALNITSDYLLGLVENDKDYLKSEALSPIERRVIDALRRGDALEAVKHIIQQAKEE